MPSRKATPEECAELKSALDSARALLEQPASAVEGASRPLVGPGPEAAVGVLERIRELEHALREGGCT